MVHLHKYISYDNFGCLLNAGCHYFSSSDDVLHWAKPLLDSEYYRKLCGGQLCVGVVSLAHA